MSGGVDSSVAAYLLKKKGYEVTGVFCHFWSEEGSRQEVEGSRGSIISNKCCSLDSEYNARRLCQKMGIPFYTFNFSREFKERIVDYFIAAYQGESTPNPCVECNRQIKFGLLFDKARQLGFNYLATGHYAQILKVKDKFELQRGADKRKDQSYFLYTLNQERLSRIIFPVGNMEKFEVRSLANKWQIPAAKREESQGICFVKEKKHNDFLKRNLKMKKGKIIDQDGKEIGQHQGLPLYTNGQREGIGVGGTGPYFVTKRDFKKNVLRVTSDPEDENLYSKKLVCQNVSWVLGNSPKMPFSCQVKVRHMKKPVEAIIKKATKNKIEAEFERQERAVMSGQSAVFYEGEKVIGGGVIV